jgi:CheY-like chemotaxis protein
MGNHGKKEGLRLQQNGKRLKKVENGRQRSQPNIESDDWVFRGGSIRVPKVLIIDDDRTMAYLLKTLLEMDGFEVVEVKDWKRILETIREELPEVVLMDYFLPDINGLVILSQLRGSSDLKEMRVIMSSGMDLSDQCIQAGADAFLLKPYAPEELVDTIKEMMDESIDPTPLGSE